LRFDIFWFTNNEGDPSANETSQDGFFNQFWDGLRKEKIPFTLHWGKFLPGYIEDGNDYSSFKDWSIHMSNQFPKWNEFLKLREQRDPHNIFLSNYWSLHLLGKPK
jgi:D-arabinono-1,4-lactone oxidase